MIPQIKNGETGFDNQFL